MKDKNNIFERGNNNFDLIRILAAFMVIYAHSYAISPQIGKRDFIQKLFPFTHAGEIAVFIFFFLSGIFKSIHKSKHLFEYAIKRIFRIYPGLIVCIILTVLMGAIISEIGINEYFKDAQVGKYIKSNIGLIWNEHFLPGVFIEHPLQGVNGSLWSITLEFRLYIIVGIIGLFGVFKEKEMANNTIILLIVCLITIPEYVPLIGSNSELLGLEVFNQYSITFFIGGLIYYNSSSFSIGKANVLMALGALILYKDTSIGKFMLIVFIITLIIYFGTRKKIISFKIPADISYGVYLYGFPIAQLIHRAIPNSGPEINAFLSIIVTFIVGTLSWYMIEKPFLGIVKNISQLKVMEVYKV